MKLNPEIFIRAAELVEAQVSLHCCENIGRASIELNLSLCEEERYRKFFRDLFGPSDLLILTGSWWRDEFACFTDRGREVRVIALLFAAEICKDYE